MSLRATLWALDQAPVKDAVGALILLALGDEAKDDGTGACPYKDKLMARARKSERTVQTYLRELYRTRLIDFGDQTIAQKRYSKAPGHAPRVWDLNLEATWDNVPEPRTDEEMKLYAQMVSGRIVSGVQAAAPQGDGVQNLHPGSDQGKRDAGGVQPTAPQTSDKGGVQNLHPESEQGKRGAGVQQSAPFPKTKRRKPSPPPSSTDASPPPDSNTQEQNPGSPLDLENQETETDVDSIDFWPTLTDWEMALLRECVEGPAGNPTWSSRKLRKVIGSRTVREITARNPELVRRAFLIGAADSGTVPMRLWHVDHCPHWKTALFQLRAEAAAADGGDETPPGDAQDRAEPATEPGQTPDRPTVPEQRAVDRVAPVSPAPGVGRRGEDSDAKLAAHEVAAAAARAKVEAREAVARESRARRGRLGERFAQAGAGAASPPDPAPEHLGPVPVG